MESLKKALELKKQLDSLRPIKKEDEERIMQKFRLDWNYHSNNLEGNSLTYGETKALILFGITAQGKPFKDSLEVKGHNDAINWVLEIVKQDRPITENFIRELHELVLKEPYEVDAITPDGKPTKKLIKIGQYKTTANHVKTKTGEIFHFSTPEETPAKMNDLMTWLSNKIANPQFNSILVAAEFHYRFIRIHPFDDGNGRVARILMNFILLQNDFPPVIIKTEDKENYFGVLRLADAGNIEPFTDYISKNLIQSLEIMIAGAAGGNIEEPDDLAKEILLLEQNLKGNEQYIEVIKTSDSISQLIYQSIGKLIDCLALKTKILENLYASSELSIDFGGHSFVIKNSLLDLPALFMPDYIDEINLIYRFENFRYDGYKEFNFHSNIQFILKKTKYFIFIINSDISVEKLYSEQLTDAEINQLINSEIRRHKEFIEQKIDEHNKQK
jgi:Fic family protein